MSIFSKLKYYEEIFKKIFEFIGETCDEDHECVGKHCEKGICIATCKVDNDCSQDQV